MKKNASPASRKRTLAICGLSALCAAVLAGTCFLKREPEREFIPAPPEASGSTDTWEDRPSADMGTLRPSPAANESTQLQGTVSDNTQTVISKDETGSTTSLPNSSTRKEALQEKPLEPPVTTDDITDPARQPEYDLGIQQAQTPAPPQDTPSDASAAETPPENTSPDSSHPGQVYDPVFGWVTPSSVQQDNIDSDGDINKQIGTM